MVTDQLIMQGTRHSHSLSYPLEVLELGRLWNKDSFDMSVDPACKAA